MFHYSVLYKTVQSESVPKVSSGTGMTAYGWNQNLDCVFPAVWYILHLPRIEFDVVHMDIELALHSHDEPHDIRLIAYPAAKFHEKLYMYGLINSSTLLICPDDLYNTVMMDPCISHPPLGICRISDLSTELLHDHWRQLAALTQKEPFMRRNMPDAGECVIDLKFPLTSRTERSVIPLIPFANQLNLSRDVTENQKELTVSNHANRYVLYMRNIILQGYQRLAREEPGFREEMEKDVLENQNFNGTPLVITLPGMLQQQSAGKKYRTLKLSENEAEAIALMGFHRASAKNALYISADSVTKGMLTDLMRLETHCAQDKIDNKYVWRVLKEFGTRLNELFKEKGIDVLKDVSQITVFSDFPIGLAVLPGCTAPLCCIKPIIYRPLGPLTNAFRFELPKTPQTYIGKGAPFKIVVAECIEKADRIRSWCDILTKQLRELIQEESDIELVVEDIASVHAMERLLIRHCDTQILVISAHGTYDDETNSAGLVIGNQKWMADDLHVPAPPVVLLSACRVMPRGFGSASVGDMFLKAGAVAVLGTLIPVNVMRSSVLIVRLFTDILEVRNGWSPFRTLDEIWTHIVASNAVHEIVVSSERLEKWANTEKGGCSPLMKFKSLCTSERLRRTHVYDDTEKLLRELARQDGEKQEHLLDSVIRSPGYFPESIFYQLIGRPENIFFRNSTMLKYMESESDEESRVRGEEASLDC